MNRRYTHAVVVCVAICLIKYRAYYSIENFILKQLLSPFHFFIFL